jgi:phosphatidylglycerophosphate synthase
MTYKEIYDIAMPPAKRKEERLNIWVTIAVRPLSVLLIKPLIDCKIRPTTITKVSILSSCIGFVLLSFSHSIMMSLLAWLFFFIWAVLDGVDGNLARCTNQCSPLGDLWDTTGGYAAMVLMYFGAGIAAFHDNNVYDFIEPSYYLIMGGATAIMSIFPRLVLHKKKSSGIESKAVKDLSDKQGFSLSKVIGMNLVSPSGALQLVLLGSIIGHVLNFFIAIYCFINFAIMIVSLRSLLKE